MRSLQGALGRPLAKTLRNERKIAAAILIFWSLMHGLTLLLVDRLVGPSRNTDELSESVLQGMLEGLAKRIPALPAGSVGRSSRACKIERPIEAHERRERGNVHAAESQFTRPLPTSREAAHCARAARRRLAWRFHLGRARPPVGGAELGNRGHQRHQRRRHECGGSGRWAASRRSLAGAASSTSILARCRPPAGIRDPWPLAPAAHVAPRPQPVLPLGGHADAGLVAIPDQLLELPSAPGAVAAHRLRRVAR